MDNNANSEVKESLKKQLHKLTIPIFIDIALVLLVGAADTFMLSLHSDESVAAVGLDNQLISLIFLVYQFISMGAAILCAQYIGAGLRKRLTQVVGIALGMNAVIGIAVSAILYFRAEEIMLFMGLRENLIDDGIIYLKITGAMSFFQAISLTLSASLRSADKTTWPMIVTLVSNILNVVGNYALIFGNWGCPALGVEGAALATAASRGIAMVLLLIIHTKVHIKRYPLQWFRPFPWSELRNLIHIGIPAMSEELSYCLSQVTITYFINKISTEALATRTYCFQAAQFGFLFCVSITQGGAILVGHLIGKHKNRAAYIMGNYIYRNAMLVSWSGAGLLAVFGHKILSILTDNELIIAMGTVVLIVDFFLSYGRIRNIFACGTLRATGDAVYPVIVGVTFQWLIAVGVSYVLGIPLGFGLIGMWIGFALDENVRGVILMRRWHSKSWTGKAFS